MAFFITSFGGPQRDGPNLVVQERNLTLPGFCGAVCTALREGYDPHLDLKALNKIRVNLLGGYTDDTEQALAALLDNRTQLNIRIRMGSAVQRLVHLASFTEGSPGSPLSDQITAVALLQGSVSDLCGPAPQLKTPEYFPELVSALATISLIARYEAENDTASTVYDLHLGMLIREVAQNRDLYRGEPKDDVIGRLTTLVSSDQRVGAQISFLSEAWDRLAEGFSRFVSKALPDFDADTVLASWSKERFGVDGVLGIKSAEEDEDVQLESLAKRFDSALDVVSRERYWQDPFSWSPTTVQGTLPCALLNVRPVWTGTSPELAFPSSPPSIALTMALDGMVDKGVGEWRFVLPTAPFGELLRELDTQHFARGAQDLVDDLNLYLATRYDGRLSSFLGCRRGSVTPGLDAAQDWLDSVSGLARAAGEASSSRQQPISVKIFLQDDPAAYEFNETLQGPRGLPLVVGDFVTSSIGRPKGIHVVDLVTLNSQFSPLVQPSFTGILQLVIQQRWLDGKMPAGRFYGIDMSMWRDAVQEINADPDFGRALLAADRHFSTDYSLFYLQRDDNENVEHNDPYRSLQGVGR